MISRGRKQVTGERGKQKQIHFSIQNLVCSNCSTNIAYHHYYWNNVCILLTTSYMFYPVSGTIFVVVVQLPVQFSLVTQSCPTLCDPMDCSMPGFPVPHSLQEFAQVHVHWMGDASSYLIICHRLLLLPSVFPNTRVFSNESAPHIRWLKYWSFSFSICPSNEYSELISLGLTGLILLSKGFSWVFSSMTV